mgnify:CR=1 FL=1
MQKLELTWIGKGKEPAVEPRILLHDSSKDYGNSNLGNMLIHGDNLLALKALEQEYTGRIKCIYIDPPYNTGNAFEYYDDNLEHSIWLNLMYPRLKSLYNLLKDGGSIWISIDDVECHYLKVMLDEIFGRDSFVADITYERSGSAGLGQGGLLVNNSEHILVYSKGTFQYNKILGSTLLEFKTMKRYNKVLVNEGERELVDEFISKSNETPVKIYKHTGFEMRTISLRGFQENEVSIRKEFAEVFEHLFRTNNVQKENVFQNDLMSRMDKKFLYTVDYIPSRGKNKDKPTTLYYYNAELFAWLKDTAYLEGENIVKTNNLTTVWKHEDIPKADLANEGGVDFPRSKKPEQLIRRILSIATDEGDLVLDSFLGSGTTAAVAQKMNRKYIGIEMGNHCYTHCKPRLDSVIDGEQSGVSKSVDWHGGGGYKFYELAPSLIEKDKYGNPVISSKYNSNMLIAAIAKLNGYNYSPDPDVFWKQGYSQDKSYIYVTTNYMDSKMLDSISSDLGNMETLLVCAPAFDIGLDKRYDNIQVKKIPQSVLDKCEYGVDNYNLNVVDIPIIDEEEWEDD